MSDEERRKKNASTLPLQSQSDPPVSQTRESSNESLRVGPEIFYSEESQQEGEGDDDDRKPAAIDFALDFLPVASDFHPMQANLDMAYTHQSHSNHHRPTTWTAYDYRAPPPYQPYPVPYDYSEPYYAEACDTATQVGGSYLDQYVHEGSPQEGVDRSQRKSPIRSSASSNDLLEIDGDMGRRHGNPDIDDFARMPTDDLFRGPLLNVDFHYPSVYFPYPGNPSAYNHHQDQHQPPNTPIQSHRYPYGSPAPKSGVYHGHIANTPIQSQRYPLVATATRDFDDDESTPLSNKKKPTTSLLRDRVSGKVKADKGVPTKKAKPQKRRIRASRTSHGSGSSSSPTGRSSPEYGHIRPDPDELNEAKTDRAKEALLNWHERLRDLYRFKKANGHTKVPQKYTTNRELGVWVNKQRMEKKAYDEGKKTSMTQRKIEKLEDAGFEWAKPKGVNAWEEKYEELQQYLREKGDANVPTKYVENRALGRWVSTQRNMYKKYHAGASFNSLPPAELERRIVLLDQLGFSWNMAPPSSSSDDPDLT